MKEIGKTKIITSLVQLLKYSSREDAVDDDVDILENVVEILETVALESGMYIKKIFTYFRVLLLNNMYIYFLNLL
jgi:hypothetical protein